MESVTQSTNTECLYLGHVVPCGKKAQVCLCPPGISIYWRKKMGNVEINREQARPLGAALPRGADVLEGEQLLGGALSTSPA